MRLFLVTILGAYLLGTLWGQSQGQDALLQLVAAAVNPDAQGDAKERMRKGLAALIDLQAGGMAPEEALLKAKTQAGLGEASQKPSKMLMEILSLNQDRWGDPATLDALRAGRMPEPPLKRP
ncbi:MAG: hypothetical protein EBS49_01990 [Verrucomicrobia bacterium]|nr:hypothetical protein [Verrucomicrobiota bacterium]